MRNSLRKLLCHLAFVAAVVFAPTLRADDLDALLAQPPSASLGKDDASRRIEMLRARAAEQPDRAEEIEAYLIPFVRVVEPPPALPAPTPAPPPAQPKPLLIVRDPGGALSTMRALSRQRQGAVVMVRLESGSRAVLQATSIAGELSWFTQEELESGVVDLNALAKSYETLARAMPPARELLSGEAEKLREMQAARNRATAESVAAAEAKLARVTDVAYRRDAGYTAAGLARQLLEAERLRRELPEFAERIDAWAEPFNEHFTKLASGNTYIDGKWVSNEQIAAEARAARQEKFLAGLDYQIPAAALPDGMMDGFLQSYLFKGGFGILAGLLALALGWRRVVLRLAGAGLAAISALGLGMVFFLATRNPAGMPGHLALVGEQAVVAVLSRAASADATDPALHSIGEDALTSFAARHIRIAVGEASPAGARRQSMVIRFEPERMAIFQLVRAAGLSWVTRLDLAVSGPDASPVVIGAQLGALAAPADFAAGLWKNLESQLAGILATSRVRSTFTIQAPGQGAVDLRLSAPKAEGKP